MRGHVELRTILRWYTPQRGQPEFDLDLAEGSTVGDVIAQLSIPDGWVGLATVNGERVEVTQSLRDGDRLLLMPLRVAGG